MGQKQGKLLQTATVGRQDPPYGRGGAFGQGAFVGRESPNRAFDHGSRKRYLFANKALVWQSRERPEVSRAGQVGCNTLPAHRRHRHRHRRCSLLHAWTPRYEVRIVLREESPHLLATPDGTMNMEGHPFWMESLYHPVTPHVSNSQLTRLTKSMAVTMSAAPTWHRRSTGGNLFIGMLLQVSHYCGAAHWDEGKRLCICTQKHCAFVSPPSSRAAGHGGAISQPLADVRAQHRAINLTIVLANSPMT